MIIQESRHEITEKEDKIVEKFSIGHYKITYIQHKNKDGKVWWNQVSVRENIADNEYIPAIYPMEEVCENPSTIRYFSIQTTSYGELPVSEIDKLIEALNEARYVADVLTKRYANK